MQLVLNCACRDHRNEKTSPTRGKRRSAIGRYHTSAPDRYQLVDVTGGLGEGVPVLIRRTYWRCAALLVLLAQTYQWLVRILQPSIICTSSESVTCRRLASGWLVRAHRGVDG